VSITDQTLNRIDQTLTRSLHHVLEHKGLFTAHVHFPFDSEADRIAILDELLNKLIHQYLKSLLIWENFETLEGLLRRFSDGEKVMSFAESESTAQTFGYLSVEDDSPIWVDRKGLRISEALQPVNEVIPVYLERNVIPEKKIGEAKTFYTPLDKYIRKKTDKNGFVLISQPPQILVNVHSKEIKKTIQINSIFRPQDIDEPFNSSLNFERYPLVIINSNRLSASNSIKGTIRPTHIVNLVNVNPKLIIRSPLSSYGRNEVILHHTSCKSLFAITSSRNTLDQESIQKVNSTFFNINEYDAEDRSVIIHGEDLDGIYESVEAQIKWITDRRITNLFLNIGETLRSYDSVLHDILFRSFRLRELLAISINNALADAVLDEMLTGKNELIPRYKGLNSYYLPRDQQQLLKNLFTQLVNTISEAYSNAGFTTEKFTSIVVAPFIAENKNFIKSLPPEVQNNIEAISQCPTSGGKILVCDYLLMNELENYRITLRDSNVSLVWIEPFFKSNYNRFKRNSIEKRLSDYDVKKHVLRDKLLTSEKSVQERLNREMATLKVEPILGIPDLDFVMNDDYSYDQTKYRVDLISNSYTLSGSERLLIRMPRSKWEVLSVSDIFDYSQDVPSAIDIDYADTNILEKFLLSNQGSQIVDWRAKLKHKVASSSLESVYDTLSKLAINYECRMVSKDWFSKDWLGEKKDNSIPNQKGLLLSLGDFLSLDRQMLRTMHIQKLNEKLQQAEINREFLVFLRDNLNLTENAAKSKIYELAKRLTTNDYFHRSYQFFRNFIAISKDDDDLLKELIQAMLDIKNNLSIKKIKMISRI
jgi:hypothetical protein